MSYKYTLYARINARLPDLFVFLRRQLEEEKKIYARENIFFIIIFKILFPH